MSTPSLESRRSFMGAGLAAGAAVLTTSASSVAAHLVQPEDRLVARMRKQAATARITTQSLRGGVSVLAGAGGNIAVLDGHGGKVLVDAGISTARRQLEAALAAISPAPISYLVNTHWHFDHTDGNEWMHAAGAIVVAHENCRKRLAVVTRIDAWDFSFPASAIEALPEITVDDSLDIHMRSETLHVESLRPAHTDTDVVVRFKEADVMHLGDIWWNGHYPFIDYSTGGSIDGTIRAVNTCLARVQDTTIIVPGHGPVGDKRQLAEFCEMLTTVRQRIATLKGQGKAIEAIIAEKPTLDFDSRYGRFLVTPADFTTLVYAGV